ncbi:MAG: porin [Pseudanabaena sp.]|nr:MAG: porin [Pseudanabaena sp.]
MSKISKKNYSIVISAAVAASALISGAANAQSSTGSQSVRSMSADTLVEQTQLRPSAVAQNVTSVSQLSDVRPTDWAFTALQSLVERYGCIAGFPDSTFRGRQATTRYEFAAGLNACLDKINEIIAAGLADKVSKEDFAVVQKLQEEFAAELATLRGRVDALEAKTALLEAQQFSTTTKLRGEAIFGLAGAFETDTTPTNNTNTVFAYRVRLNLDTSFTGKDLLRTRLQASNTPNLSTALNPGVLDASSSSSLSFQSGTPNNAFEINRLFYRFPLGNTFTAYIAPIGAPEDVLDPMNPIESDSQGTLSRFLRFNPLIRIASNNGSSNSALSGLAIAGFDWKISDQGNFQFIYSATNPADASGQGGLGGGGTKLAAQLVYKPMAALKAAFGYAYAYTPGNTLASGLNADSFGGFAVANVGRPYGNTNGVATGPGGTITGIQSNTIVGSLVWDITPKFTFNTWGSYIFANSTGTAGANTTFTSWVTTFSGKDLFLEGDQAAISFGQPLQRTNVGGVAQGSPGATPYLLETFYRFRVSKNISITPGIYWVFNQGSSSANGTATVGVIRTTFSF